MFGEFNYLRDLDVGCCSRITDIGLRHLTSWTLLTRLVLDYLGEITDKGVEYLVILAGLRELRVDGCLRVSDNLASRYHGWGSN